MKVHSKATVEAQIQELRTITWLQGEPHTGDCHSGLPLNNLPSSYPPRLPQRTKVTEGTCEGVRGWCGRRFKEICAFTTLIRS